MGVQKNSKANNAVTVKMIRDAKGSDTPLVGLTSYSAHAAKLVDDYVDFILIGDSLGMVFYGYKSTIPVDLNTMIMHAKAVASGSKRALKIVDLPFGSYEKSPQQAFDTSVRVLKETGCEAVKIEGGKKMAETVKFLSSRGVPVMGHIGLTPQSINMLGSYEVVGKSLGQQEKVVADALSLSQSGVFAIVIECVVPELVNKIAQVVDVPTIGIGASTLCDGQVLVLEDMLGITSRVPKFVKRYANIAEEVRRAVSFYAEEVRNRKFPSEHHIY